MTNHQNPIASLSPPRALSFISRGIWAIMDQGLFALSNFLLLIMLARWLGPGEYGLFAVQFAILILLSTGHTAIITEPLMIFGSGRYREHLSTYISAVKYLHWQLTISIAVPMAVMGIIGRLVYGYEGGASLAVMAFAMPFILWQWMLRRACYVATGPRTAALSGAIYLGSMLAGALALQAAGWFSAVMGLLLMTASSIAAAGVILKNLRSLNDSVPGTQRFATTGLLREHWAYGRWSGAAMALGWASSEGFYPLLAMFHGFDATGTFRAAMNIIAPALHGFLALALAALPALTTAHRNGTLERTARLLYGSFSLLAISFAGVLLFAAEPLVDILYDKKYEGIVPVLRVLALVPIAIAITRVAGAALHAMEYPRGIFEAYIASAALTLSIGVAITWLWGAPGAAWATLVISLVVTQLLVVKVANRARKN